MEEAHPRFVRLIACRQPLGFIRVFRSDERPAYGAGQEVTGEELTELLTGPRSWAYAEEPTQWICVASGDRPISELEEGMGDEGQ
ncbi:hypothetical protein [Streptomyces sp. NPDC055134]